MFTDKIEPVDIHQAIQEIGLQIDLNLSQSILDELFNTWICSEEPETTDSKHRRDVVQTVQVLRQLLSLTQTKEVCYD